MTKKIRRFPHLGKLSVAILESRVKTLIGEEAIKVLKEPLEEKQLKDALADTLAKAEERFFKEHDDDELCVAILSLPLADLPAVRNAVRNLYDRPADPSLANMLKKQLTIDYPLIITKRIDHAVTKYLSILREELVSVDDAVRQRLIAIALLGIQKTLMEITEGEKLYHQYSQTPLLSQHIRIREFQTLVNERTKNFVGRDFIFKTIDDLIKDSDFPSGYIVISGEPGIGKTALLAQLIKRKGYVHHFNIAAQNIRFAQDFLANICAQLIVKYNLEHRILPPEAEKDSGFLSWLLSEVANKEQGQAIVILVDAVDEAEDIGLASGVNILYLPQALPNGVYFVVTTRTKANYRLFTDRRKDIYICDDDPCNLDDVRCYIWNFIEEYQTQMKSRIEQWGVKKDRFVEMITEKSEGNFMYLVYVLGDIRDGKLTADNVENVRDLPQGLQAYYQRHWRAMRAQDEEKFDKYQEPVVCILATIREPVTIAQVQEWTELKPTRIKQVIDEWREFLNVDESGDEPLYRIYHASFQDFLKEEVGLVKYHDRIAVVALRKIPGFLDG